MQGFLDSLRQMQFNRSFANAGQPYNDMLGRYGNQVPPTPGPNAMPNNMGDGFLDQLMQQQGATVPPMGLSPAEAQASEVRAPQPQMGFLDSLSQRVGDNSGMLMGLGSGLLSRGWAGVGDAMTGMEYDENRRAAEEEQAQMEAQRAAQMRLGEQYGVDPLTFEAGMGDFALEQALTPAERIDPVRLGQNDILVNPMTGETVARGGARGVPGEIDPAQAAEETARFRSIDHQSATLLENADAGLEMLDATPNRVAGFGSLFSGVPGGAARDFQARLDAIKALVGFDALQQMRENSPTGGALGQVTERELAFLQSVEGSLDQAQSPEQLRQILQRLRDGQAYFRDLRRQAYVQDFGQEAPSSPFGPDPSVPVTTPSTPAPAAVPQDRMDDYNSLTPQQRAAFLRAGGA